MLNHEMWFAKCGFASTSKKNKVSHTAGPGGWLYEVARERHEKKLKKIGSQ